MSRWALVLVTLAASVAGTSSASAEEPPEGVETIVVRGRGTRTATTPEVVPAADFELRALESGGQMIDAVPGAITAQHTGGGKAEQYFIRGFDADHGTDLAVYFDGVPINLRSHAHGQGFLDLHFVTVESIERLDVQKGPYSARYGDFATAATIEYVPWDQVDESSVTLEAGEFETLRGVGLFGSDAFGADTVVAVEGYHTDGPFRNDEDLNRYSAFGRSELELTPDLRISGHALGYTAEWDASGLVPERLVDANELSRFGSIDPTEGGESHRVQGKLQLDWDADNRTRLTTNAYALYYELRLYSNFSYFLDDPVDGDGIVQKDRRVQAGGRTEVLHVPDLDWLPGITGGFEWRLDDAHVRLGPQTARRRNGPYTSDDEVLETSLAPYTEIELQPLPWIDVVGGLRYEALLFDVDSQLAGGSDSDGHDDLWMPKANLVLAPFGPGSPWTSEWSALRRLELFGHFGVGFHSNDARTGVDDDRLMARATGAELGLRSFLFDRLSLSAELFWLEIEDELVFVGDEGVTESSGRSRRLGLEAAAHLFLTEWLYLRGDVSWVDARYTRGDERIPQAPTLIAKGALGGRWKGFSVELSARHLGERSASEDFSTPKLSDYTVLDLGASWRRGPLELGVAVENLTGTEWRSSEFFYTSQLASEAAPVDDFHFTPGNRRNVRGWVRIHF